MSKYILDLSYHNSNVDMKKIKESGIYGVILRAGYGFNTIDKNFYKNIENALKNGLHVGVYWFGYAGTVEHAKKEAEYFLSIISKYNGKIDLPVFYDWEYDSFNYVKKTYDIKATKQLVSDMTNAFCTTLEKNGWYAGFYANIDYLDNYYTTYIKKRFALWVASWTTTNSYKSQYMMWQFTDSASVNGVTGKVDKSILKDETIVDTIKNAGLNGYSKDSKVYNYDVNGDGVVDEKDLKLLQEYLKSKGVI